MRAPVLAIATGLALAAVSTQAATLSPNNENRLPLGATLSFSLGNDACGDGWHRSLWRDWRGDWWWGPCVPIAR